ncbi:hypothetical protein MTP99_002548 [Tenebrio molitor]|nr:hypothetical protein MTP99_002548 [Tenebrio molitor]
MPVRARCRKIPAGKFDTQEIKLTLESSVGSRRTPPPRTATDCWNTAPHLLHHSTNTGFGFQRSHLPRRLSTTHSLLGGRMVNRRLTPNLHVRPTVT